jgi:hypothetical protein
MGYKRQTKIRSKLMKRIRKVVPKQDHIHWPTTPPSRNIDVRQWRCHKTVKTQVLILLYQQSHLMTTPPHPPFNPVAAYMPEKSLPYLRRDTLPQCMNAIRSPNRPKQTLGPETQNTHKRKRYFLPSPLQAPHQTITQRTLIPQSTQ